MRVWVSLYGLVWLVTLEFLTVLVVPRSSPVAMPLHIALGAAVVLAAISNARAVERTLAPLRTKRIARALSQMTVAGGITGVLLYVGFAPSLGLISGGPLRLIHIITALAAITQVASIATSYDMWEEKESVDSLPGPAPARAPPAPHSRAY